MKKIITFLKDNIKTKKFLFALLAIVFVYTSQRNKKSDFYLARPVVRGEITQEVSASGEVKSETQIKVQFQTSGKLAWLGVKEGDRVKKWQALASLDKEDLKKRFQKEMNDYLNERWDFEQTQDDYKQTKEKSLVTDSIKRILEKAQFDLNNSVLDVELSDLAVKYATIYSPIDGIVTEVVPSVAGLNVLFSSSYIEVADPGLMKIEAVVDEVDVVKIKENQEAVITLDAFPGEEFSGKISKIAYKSSVTKSGGTGYVVSVSVPLELAGRLRLGFNAEIKIVTEKKAGVLLVPLEALIEEDKAYVFRAVDGKAMKTPVKIGLTNDLFAEISEGLKEQDLVLFEKTASLKDGQSINVKKTD